MAWASFIAACVALLVFALATTYGLPPLWFVNSKHLVRARPMCPGRKVDLAQVGMGALDDYASLFADTFSRSPWNEPWSIEAAHERLVFCRDAPGFLGISARVDKQLLGLIFGNIEPGHCQGKGMYLLREMCVAHECQRSGIGAAMLDQLRRTLATREVATVNLLTRVGAPAERFYFQNGFAKSQSMGVYYATLSI